MNETAQVVLIVGGVFGVLGATVRAGWGVYRFARRIEKSLTYVEEELRFNGGTTMRDAVKRLETAGDVRSETLARIEARLQTVEDEVTP